MSNRVYISGALISSADLAAARAKYEACAAALNSSGFMSYLPHMNTDPYFMSAATAEDVFTADIKALMSSDAVVAILDEPSHGVGAEIAICVTRKIPIIALAHSGVTISRFIQGLIEKSGASEIIYYNDFSDIINVLPRKVDAVVRLKESISSDELAELLRSA
jgi:nucleoside 2-deoxyribosyltransferase